MLICKSLLIFPTIIHPSRSYIFVSFSSVLCNPASASTGNSPLLCLFAFLSLLSCSRSNFFSFSASSPVFVSSFCLLNTFLVIKKDTASPTAEKATYMIHIVERLSEKACRATFFWSSGNVFTMPTFAPADPPPRAAAVWGPSEACKMDSFETISFWNTTEPTTIAIAEPRLRTKPKVAVAVAISRFFGIVSVILQLWNKSLLTTRTPPQTLPKRNCSAPKRLAYALWAPALSVTSFW